MENTLIGKIAEEVKFEYFHNKLDSLGEILPSYKMVEDDPDLLYSFDSQKKIFADSCAPVRGCIRIAMKKNIKEN